MPVDENDRYTIAVEDLTHFLETGLVQDVWGNTVMERWWHLHKDGTLTVDDEARAEPHTWPVPLMSWPGQEWIDQWDGDLQKAIDTQVQPALERIADYFKNAEELGHAGS